MTNPIHPEHTTMPFCPDTFTQLLTTSITAASTFARHRSARIQGTITLSEAGATPTLAAHHQETTGHTRLAAEHDKALAAQSLADLAQFVQDHPCALFHPQFSLFFNSSAQQPQSVSLYINSGLITEGESITLALSRAHTIATQAQHLQDPGTRIFAVKAGGKSEGKTIPAASPEAAAALYTLLHQFAGGRKKGIPTVSEILDPGTYTDAYTALLDNAGLSPTSKKTRKKASQ